MIDLGLTKLAVIGVVALLVIGPEKLPKVARMAGSLFGRAQRYINQVKSEVSREMELDELHKLHKEMQDAVGDAKKTIEQGVSEVKSDLDSTWNEIAKPDQGQFPGFQSALPSATQLAAKVKEFRKKKLARLSAVPSWYKHRSGHRTRVISGAARVARYRPAGAGKTSSSTFH
jgi:sec-independent protein translocase protein TatB